MSSQTYEIKLDNIFEGPMDLLVHLIKKNEVDIYDIPIALITDQFLAYLDWMKVPQYRICQRFSGDGRHPDPYQIQNAVAAPSWRGSAERKKTILALKSPGRSWNISR